MGHSLIAFSVQPCSSGSAFTLEQHDRPELPVNAVEYRYNYRHQNQAYNTTRNLADALRSMVPEAQPFIPANPPDTLLQNTPHVLGKLPGVTRDTLTAKSLDLDAVIHTEVPLVNFWFLSAITRPLTIVAPLRTLPSDEKACFEALPTR